MVIIYFLGLLITNQLLKPLVNTLLDDWGLLSDDDAHDDDMITCRAALSSTGWDKNPSYASAVVDAKRRGFTPQKCVELLGRKITGSPAVKTPQRQDDDTIAKRLSKLKTLLDKGLLTPDEAAEKHKQILDSL